MEQNQLSLFYHDRPLKFIPFGPDSGLIYGYMKTVLQLDPEAVMDSLINDDRFYIPRYATFMKYRGNELPRRKFFIYRDAGHGMIPRYMYPGWQWETLQYYRKYNEAPVIQYIADFFTDNITYSLGDDEERHTVNTNLVIGTLYEYDTDNISFHDDKPKDIQPGTLILTLSMGCERELHLKNNTDGSVIPIVMKPGSLFVLGPQTNREWKHSLVEVKKEQILDKKREIEPRLSLVFRDIKTKVSREEAEEQVEKKERKKKK